jgi:phage I-like protein
MELLRPIANCAADGDFQLPADGFVQIVPLGEFEHEKSCLTQVIDRVAIDTMVNQFRKDNEVLIDFDHESLNSDKRTTASGWLKNLQARADGLWAQIRWSKSGSDAVTGGDYRFLSPVFRANECESLGNNRIRPLRLDSAGLTNRPNLIGIEALANRDEVSDKATDKLVEPERQFSDHVRELMRARKISFERSWDAAKTAHPEAYRKMLDIFVNSAHCPPGLKNKVALGQDSVPATCPPPHSIATFNGRVEAFAAEHDCPFEIAWEKVKATHPFDFGNAVKLGEMMARQSGQRSL